MSDEYAPYMDEQAAESAYDDFLNAIYGMVDIGGIQYDPAEILKAVDPTHYREGFNNWLDSESRA